MGKFYEVDFIVRKIVGCKIDSEESRFISVLVLIYCVFIFYDGFYEENRNVLFVAGSFDAFGTATGC
ncbi:hypothetical protein H9W95_17700 [Flavobacterium lindanitolerans]|nr:hypothetical protein [Flavobacterium lindanitolerans]